MLGKSANYVATKTLRKLELIEDHEEVPPPSNASCQVDVWSCGLWASRWFERQSCDNRGEASLAEMRNRTNESISKMRGAKQEREEKTKKVSSKHYETHEPVHVSFEDAQAAVQQVPADQGKQGVELAWASMSKPFAKGRPGASS